MPARFICERRLVADDAAGRDDLGACRPGGELPSVAWEKFHPKRVTTIGERAMRREGENCWHFARRDSAGPLAGSLR